MPRTIDGKDSIVDVFCETNDKRQFIVEMQMYWSNNFMQRVLFNSSKVYVSQLKQGEPFSNLQPVYSLNLIDDIFEPDMEEYYHYYHLVHDKDTKKTIDGFHLVFVELKKFKPKTMSERAKLKAVKIDTAQQMKKDGMSVELITKYTGLSAEEIDRLS